LPLSPIITSPCPTHRAGAPCGGVPQLPIHGPPHPWNPISQPTLYPLHHLTAPAQEQQASELNHLTHTPQNTRNPITTKHQEPT
ncbi:Hypothetical predicted protein, partial [Pelobates cultripes]